VQTTKVRLFLCAFCTVLTVTAVLLSLTRQSTAISAQQYATPDIPSPAECTIAPRSVPSPPTSGEATPSPGLARSLVPNAYADEETVAEITAVVRGSIACSNAGDILRALAYFSDDYVAQMFNGPDGVDYEGFLQYLATPAVAVPPDQQLAIISIDNVQWLDHIYVGATVVTGDPAKPYSDYLIFVKEDGQWRIASSSPMTTVYASPTP
jgi:hypothetical protein